MRLIDQIQRSIDEKRTLASPLALAANDLTIVDCHPHIYAHDREAFPPIPDPAEHIEPASAEDLKAKGVDEIVATAVNDAFVMGAWNSAAGSDDITMLADGNGEFAEAVGLTMDGSGFGMGKRGQRYSMVVEDGVVKQLNVEAPGDFSVSSAEHMLGQL